MSIFSCLTVTCVWVRIRKLFHFAKALLAHHFSAMSLICFEIFVFCRCSVWNWPFTLARGFFTTTSHVRSTQGEIRRRTQQNYKSLDVQFYIDVNRFSRDRYSETPRNFLCTFVFLTRCIDGETVFFTCEYFCKNSGSDTSKADVRVRIVSRLLMM